jgi:predicted nucleotidyltransferase
VVDIAPILRQIKESVHATDPSATIILFGSYARGEQHAESDIDLLILLDKEKVTHEDNVRISYPLFGIGIQEDMHISPKLYSRNYWYHGHMVTPFYENVNKDGILI